MKMKKHLYIAIIGSFALITLQLIWVYNTYYMQKNEFEVQLNSSLKKSIDNETSIRVSKNKLTNFSIHLNYYEDIPKNELTKTKYKTQDTASLNMQNKIAASLPDFISQIQQDELIKLGAFVDLSILDSIFISSFNVYDSHLFKHTIQLMDNKNHILKNSSEKTYREKSNKFYIGTKKKQFVIMSYSYPINSYLKNNKIILYASALIFAIILWMLFIQLAVIEKKEGILSKRETDVYGLIHDLKSPLANVLFVVSAIISEISDIEQKEILLRAKQKVKSLSLDIEQLLITYKGIKCGNSTDFSNIRTNTLISNAINKIDEQLLHKSNSATIVQHSDIEYLYGNQIALESVLKNLIENSFKYSNDNVLVNVHIYTNGKYNIIEVKDNGFGINKKEIKNIFSPFYQSPSHKTGGYGLGLSYVNSIIKSHKGKLKIHSVEKSGTTIRCLLPRMKNK